MRKAGQFMKGVVKSLKAEKAIELHRLREAWMEAVGPLLAGQAEPSRIQGKTLYVVVSSPHWNQEISMQQKLILQRLRSSLNRPLKKIVCWVGQPHQRRGPASTGPITQEEEAPWLQVEIPEKRRQRMEEELAGIQDEQMRGRIRKLRQLAIQRELYLLAQGMLPCPICGVLREPTLKMCDDCRREKTEDGEREVLRALARRPWLTVKDLQDRFSGLTRAVALRLRKQLRTNLLGQAWAKAAGLEGEELTRLIDQEFAQLLRKITMLSCSLREDSLTPRHFHYALGRRLASSLLEAEKAHSLSTLDNH